jgi:hypothetical protein
MVHVVAGNSEGFLGESLDLHRVFFAAIAGLTGDPALLLEVFLQQQE